MSVDNVYAYLDALQHKKEVPGAVVEIGCASGGSTVLACRFLSMIGCEKQYYCVDTFSGFTQQNLDTDHELGLHPRFDGMFANNSAFRFSKNIKNSSRTSAVTSSSVKRN